MVKRVSKYYVFPYLKRFFFFWWVFFCCFFGGGGGVFWVVRSGLAMLLSRHSVGIIWKQAHMQLVREHLVTVVSAH